MMANSETKLILPAVGGLYASGQKISPLILRLVAGIWLIPHGWPKVSGGAAGTAQFFSNIGLEPALLLAWVTGITEFVGGICIAIGFLTRIWAAGGVILMLVAAFAVHWPNGFGWTNGGWEYPIFWAFMLLIIFFRGGGDYSVDKALGKEF